MDKYPIVLDGKAVGELQVTQEGLYTSFAAACCLPPQKLFRLFAVGEGGELRLGIPEPAGAQYALRRSLTARETASAGRLLRGELRPCADQEECGWSPAAFPERLFRSAFLRERLHGMTGALTRQEKEIRSLALPFDNRSPFPLTPLFCFASVRRINGKAYAVFSFDREEYPVFLA